MFYSQCCCSNVPLTVYSNVDAPADIISSKTTNSHLMVTRAKDGIFKPKVYITHTVPKSIKHAMSDENWAAAMKSEYQALLSNNTWTLVSLPPNKSITGCKWVFRIKENIDGSVKKFKSELVVKGYDQSYGLDFHETSPVVKPTNIRTVLSVALSHAWNIYQIYVNNAFLNVFF